MCIINYSKVRLITDKFKSTDGVSSGEIGYVIEIYPPDNYEVEFSDSNGITYAQFVTKLVDIEIAEE